MTLTALPPVPPRRLPPPDVLRPGRRLDADRRGLVERHLQLAYHTLWHACPFMRAVGRDELRSLAHEWLVEAAGRYDPYRGVRFSTFARHHLGLKARSFGSTRRRTSRRRPPPVSLADLVADDGQDAEGLADGRAADPAEAAADRLDDRAERDRLVGLFAALGDREFLILAARYGLLGGRPMLVREVATCLGISRERTRQLEVEAVAKLRELAKGDDTSCRH